MGLGDVCPEVLKASELAEALGLSDSYVRELCQAGTIRAESTEGGHWRIPAAELVALGLFACDLRED
jgi:excisionase family DNA binding protein